MPLIAKLGLSQSHGLAAANVACSEEDPSGSSTRDGESSDGSESTHWTSSVEEALCAYGQRFGRPLQKEVDTETQACGEQDAQRGCRLGDNILILNHHDYIDEPEVRRRADLEKDLGLEAGSLPEQRRRPLLQEVVEKREAELRKAAAEVPGSLGRTTFRSLRDALAKTASLPVDALDRTARPETGSNNHAEPGGGLQLTFGYAGSLDQRAPFARFDIRASVCMQVGGFTHGQVVRDYGRKPVRELVVIGVKQCQGTPQLWFQPRYMKRPAAFAFPGASAALLAEMLVARDATKQRLQEASLADFDLVEDPDGEVLRLCSHCRLPIGDVAYAGEGASEAIMHGECTAQCMLRRWNEEEEARQQEDASKKSRKREEYGIGWNINQIPCNADRAATLGCRPASSGMCCVVFDEACQSLALGATLDPAASVNLEYLAIALRVRILEGKEPYFSLDPVYGSSEEPSASMQAKHFTPAWLAGTRVGDILFQADYHLKELSMGECAQPVLGMKSSFDFSEDVRHDHWAAREWFVVKDAGIQVSQDNVLMPYAKMGIEARELTTTSEGVEDALITRPDHPLVKYAEEFTHYFDLIAERKSVIYHLRDLAKAAVLAKFIAESAIGITDDWMSSVESQAMTCCLEIPQLWNERRHSQIQVADGTIVNDEEEIESRRHMVYGGIHFGLERVTFESQRNVTPLGQVVLSTRMPTLRAPTPMVAGAAISLAMRRSPALFTGPPPAMGIVKDEVYAGFTFVENAVGAVLPTIYSRSWRHQMRSPDDVWDSLGRPGAPRFNNLQMPPSQRAAKAKAEPQKAGVDLNLDSFDLSPSEVQVSQERVVEKEISLEQGSLGKAFWIAFDGGPDWGAGTAFSEDAQSLLEDIFNPRLSDRRKEGDKFVPPETTETYVQKLRSLVQEEKVARQRRKHHFCSQAFSVDDPGPLFPYSWKASFEIARGASRRPCPASLSSASSSTSSLHERPDYKQEVAVFRRLLRSATPSFDKVAEDGARFRVYHFGSLEVRSIQELGEEEGIGVIFSSHAPGKAGAALNPGLSDSSNIGEEKIVKVTEYVQGSLQRYVVLETERGTTLVTEMLEDGSISWEVNPQALDVRNSLAKVFSSGDCHHVGAVIKDVWGHQVKESSHRDPHQWSDLGRRKRYAEDIYARARKTETTPTSACRAAVQG